VTALPGSSAAASPAAAAGMTGGSVITAVNGTPVTSPDDLTSMLARHHDLGGLDQPDGKAGHQQPAPDRRAAPVISG
jgi:S1-C subfamily serine protease